MEGPSGWFSGSEAAGLEDFWRVYEGSYDRINEATLAFARADPDLSPILRALSPEQLAAQQRDSRARLARAIAGSWGDYERSLRTQGELYAGLGLPYATWWRLAGVVARELTPLLVSAYAESPARLTRALLAMQGLFDWAMAVIAEAYIAAKEAALREREQDLATTLDSIGDGVIATDERGAVTRMNPVAERLTGWSLADAAGRPLREVFRIVNEETRAEVESPAERALREGVIIGLANHTLLLARDGAERPIADSAAPIRGAAGETRGVVLVFRDQTESRAAEAALQRSRETLEATLAGLHEGVVIADPAGDITYRNREARRMFPVGASNVGGSTGVYFADGMAPCPPDRIPLARALRGEHVRECELFVRNDNAPDGIFVSVNAGPIGDPGGALGAVASFRDVTERRRLQAQLLMSERMASIGLLAAGVAHEINNPLAALQTNIALALRALSPPGGAPAPAPLKDALDGLSDARDAAERLGQIVRDIKLFSRAEDEARSRVDLRRLLESTLRIAWNEIRHRARLTKDFQPIPAVEANESRLGQVFLNLFTNAAQSIPEGAAEANEIRISTRTDPAGNAVVDVEDTGCGIDLEAQKRLFVPFFTTKPAGVGTGLGLSICHRLVDALGGRIEVASAPGRGSRFRVVLPASAAADVAPPAPPVAAAPRRGRVLLVDDEPMIASSMRRLIEPEHDVEIALTGEKALAIIRAGARFDVILCDMMMPQITGMDVHAELLRLAPDQAEKMIFLTGGAFTPRARAFLDATSNPLLEKPFDPDALLALLNRRVR
jgi:PAS domain S-box-containing protein